MSLFHHNYFKKNVMYSNILNIHFIWYEIQFYINIKFKNVLWIFLNDNLYFEVYSPTQNIFEIQNIDIHTKIEYLTTSWLLKSILSFVMRYVVDIVV